MSLEGIRRYVAEECVQPDPIVNKMSGGWSQHPIFGPMYGPAYLYGSTVVRDTITKYGADKVISVAFFSQGIVDLDTFSKKMVRIH